MKIATGARGPCIGARSSSDLIGFLPLQVLAPRRGTTANLGKKLPTPTSKLVDKFLQAPPLNIIPVGFICPIGVAPTEMWNQKRWGIRFLIISKVFRVQEAPTPQAICLRSYFFCIALGRYGPDLT